MEPNQTRNDIRFIQTFSRKIEVLLEGFFKNLDLIVNLSVIISSLLILFNIFGLNPSSMLFLPSSLFVIYIVPGYQLFFKTFKDKYTAIEKLALTIVFGMIINIISGILAGHLGIPITGLFYLCFIIIFYYILLVLNFHVKGRYPIERFESVDVRKLIPKNLLLFIVLAVLLSVFLISRYPILFGDDPWFHLILTNEIVNTGVIPFDSYRGANGLHLMGALIHFFSGHPTLDIVRFFPIINYVMSGLMGFAFFNRLFKNEQIGIIGSLLLLIAPFRYDFAQSQFFPTALGLTVFLFMMFLYIEHIRYEDIATRQIFIFYILSGLAFFSLVFISDISAILFPVFFILFSIVFTIQNKRRIGDLVFYIMLLVIYGIYNLFAFKSIIFVSILGDFSFSPIFIPILMGGAVVGIFIFRILNKFTNYTKGAHEEFMKKPPQEVFLKRMMTKYLKPVMFIVLLALPIIVSFLIFISFDINLDFFYILTYVVNPIINAAISMLLAFWGLLLFKRAYKDGAIIYWWAIFSLVEFLAFVIFDIVFLHYMLYLRMLMYTGIGIVCGEMAYFAYLYKDRFVNKRKLNQFYLLFFIYTIASSLLVSVNVTQFKKKYEIGFPEWYGEHSSEQSSFLTGFRWNYVLDYYSGENQTIYFNEAPLLFPTNQVNSSNFNFLRQFQQLKSENNLYLVLDEKQISEGIFGDVVGIYIGKINQSILKEYYDLPYLNRIFSSKNQLNQRVQIYWLNSIEM